MGPLRRLKVAGGATLRVKTGVSGHEVSLALDIGRPTIEYHLVEQSAVLLSPMSALQRRCCKSLFASLNIISRVLPRRSNNHVRDYIN